jgi:hypothetical protein
VILEEKEGVKPKKGGTEMEWQIIVALVVVAPLILLPAALIWYIHIGGIYTALRQRAAAHRHPAEATAGAGE